MAQQQTNYQNNQNFALGQQHQPPPMVNGYPPMANNMPTPVNPMQMPAQQQINYQNFQTKAIQQQAPLPPLGSTIAPAANFTNGSHSALSSRTASPSIQQPPNIPQSQLPPSKSYPNYQQLHGASNSQPQPPSQFPPTSAPLLNINNNNNNDQSQVLTPNKSSFNIASPLNASTPNPLPNGANQLSSSMKNLNMNPMQHPMPGQFPLASLPTSKSDQNLLNNNNNNINGMPQMQHQMAPKIPDSTPQMMTNNLHQPPQQLAYPQAEPPKPVSHLNAMNKRPMYPTANVQQQPGMQQQYPAQQLQQQQQQPPQPQLQQQQFNNYPGSQQLNQNQRGNLQYQNLQQPQQQQQQQQQQPQMTPQQQYPQPAGGIVAAGFNRMWGNETVDLMQQRHILPPTKVLPPPIKLNHQFHEAVNCSPDIFRCTLTKIPESNSLLQKSRLPLGVLIHPYRDLSNLPVISCSTIVRCRVCRTYINPFVFFVDSKKWKCNLCYRVNELPEEFQFDPVSKTYGDPTRRPEIKSSTIEFIAPSEYMLRPPQPAVYLFLLDVSGLAQQSGYLEVACQTISEQLNNLPGDARTQVGFVAYNSAVHFYNIAEGFNQPHEITVLDIDDVFLPCPDNLLINLKECRELINDLLLQLPKRYANDHDNQSALGAALQVAFKLMGGTGGRVAVFQTCLPNCGPGALQSRENPNDRSSKDVQHLGPATDFYKRLALECSGQQIAVDLFLLNSQYSDLATLSGISKFSGGSIHHFPLFNINKLQQVIEFKKSLERYLTRKIGFESVMRVRCTRGLSIHTFHGNFFVRSTDLLSLPNVNPDSGFGMQITYDESLADVKTVCFQAALLYTSSKAERRIRVHTMCLPVTDSLTEVLHSADAQCIVGLLSKMAVDRSLASNMSDARDAFINATVDVFSAYKLAQNLPSGASGLVGPQNLALLPLYILALLKQTAFRTGTSTRLDDRVYAMCQMKSLPLDQLIRYIYPDFYLLDPIFTEDTNKVIPPKLQLSAERLDSRSIFLLDNGVNMYIYVGSNANPSILKNVFGKNNINEIPDMWYDLPKLETPSNEALHEFIDSLNEEKPFSPGIQIIRDTSPCRSLLVQHLVDDRNENSLSYYEFLQHLRTQVK